MADEAPRFVRFGTQSINVKHIIRAEWKVSAEAHGRHATLHVVIADGHQLIVSCDDPQCKKFAELLGFNEEHAGWPKAKAAADAAYAKAIADQKAAQEAARRRLLTGVR